MNAVPFDTLKMAQRLEAAGFSAPQAAGAAEALAEALLGADLATKGDIASTKTEIVGTKAEIKTEIDVLRTEMQNGFAAQRSEFLTGLAAQRTEFQTGLAAQRTEFQTSLAAQRSEMHSGFELQRRDMELLRRDMTIRLGGMIVVGFGLMGAIMRLLPLDP